MNKDGKPDWWRGPGLELATEEKLILMKAVILLNKLAESPEECELSSDALEILIQNDIECGEIYAKHCLGGQLLSDDGELDEKIRELTDYGDDYGGPGMNAAVKQTLTGSLILFLLALLCPVMVACANIGDVPEPVCVDTAEKPAADHSPRKPRNPESAKVAAEAQDGRQHGKTDICPESKITADQVASIGDIKTKPPPVIIEMPSGDPDIKKTYNRKDGTTTYKLRKPEQKIEKLTPVCHVTPAMIRKLNELVKERSDDLFNRWIPPISFNVGTRFNTGFVDQDYLRDTATAPGQKRDYPSLGVSLSIPLYNPDTAAAREQGKANFLVRNLGYLRDLEYHQKLLASLVEKRKLIRRRIKEEGFMHINELYQNEQRILENISLINLTIRYFEQAFDIDMKELSKDEK